MTVCATATPIQWSVYLLSVTRVISVIGALPLASRSRRSTHSSQHGAPLGARHRCWRCSLQSADYCTVHIVYIRIIRLTATSELGCIQYTIGADSGTRPAPFRLGLGEVSQHGVYRHDRDTHTVGPAPGTRVGSGRRSFLKTFAAPARAAIGFHGPPRYRLLSFLISFLLD